ncbi:hypothetical protein LV35_04235 [Acinetobacter baumannii]|uniref:Uncharacterized protein n=1 Tax=Acinetobacter baumannii TaxID=470 RepID=A0AAJ0VMH1_ACIBA|nr:hypothetical protein LV35_04235 [Acinetobacter baumannii]
MISGPLNLSVALKLHQLLDSVQLSAEAIRVEMLFLDFCAGLYIGEGRAVVLKRLVVLPRVVAGTPRVGGNPIRVGFLVPPHPENTPVVAFPIGACLHDLCEVEVVVVSVGHIKPQSIRGSCRNPPCREPGIGRAK